MALRKRGRGRERRRRRRRRRRTGPRRFRRRAPARRAPGRRARGLRPRARARASLGREAFERRRRNVVFARWRRPRDDGRAQIRGRLAPRESRAGGSALVAFKVPRDLFQSAAAAAHGRVALRPPGMRQDAFGARRRARERDEVDHGERPRVTEQVHRAERSWSAVGVSPRGERETVRVVL